LTFFDVEEETKMNKLTMTAAGVALAGATALATMPANAFWGSWGSGPWYGGPWYGGPWYGGYPYYGGWGGYPGYGGWGGYPYYGGWGGYPGYGGWGYPYAVAPVAPMAVQPATTEAAK
jgi:hypothetical protein